MRFIHCRFILFLLLLPWRVEGNVTDSNESVDISIQISTSGLRPTTVNKVEKPPVSAALEQRNLTTLLKPANDSVSKPQEVQDKAEQIDANRQVTQGLITRLLSLDPSIRITKRDLAYTQDSPTAIKPTSNNVQDTAKRSFATRPVTRDMLSTKNNESPTHPSSLDYLSGRTKRDPDSLQGSPSTVKPTNNVRAVERQQIADEEKNSTTTNNMVNGPTEQTTSADMSTHQPVTTFESQNGDPRTRSMTTYPKVQFTPNITATTESPKNRTQGFLISAKTAAPNTSMNTSPFEIKSEGTVKDNTTAPSVSPAPVTSHPKLVSSSATSSFMPSTVSVAQTNTSTALTAASTMATKTKYMTTKGNSPTTEAKTSLTTKQLMPSKSHTTKKKSVNPHRSSQHGTIVAVLIGGTLILMLIGIVVILFKKRRMKKRMLENPDWAGPSPFLDGNIQPNLPKLGEDKPFCRQESKRVSITGFLPHRLSKRLSLLKETDDEVLMEDITNSTFGSGVRVEVQPNNGSVGVEQDQTQTQGSKDNVPPLSETTSDTTAPVSDLSNSSPSAAQLDISQTDNQETNTDIPPAPPLVDVNLESSSDEKTTALPSSDDAVTTPPAPPLPSA